MTEIKEHYHLEEEKNPVATFQQFWEKNSKMLGYIIAAVVLLVGGYWAYQNYVKEPNEKKAYEALFHAEDYYRMDSVTLALNGDNINAGFVKVVNKYSGTRAAKLAGFYAGSCYLKLGDFNNAIKYLKDFTSSVPQLQAKAYGLLGDAYSELDKKEEALSAYKLAGSTFDQDAAISSEYLFRAGSLLERMGRNKEAIDLYQTIKDKYPGSQRGYDIDRYLARLGSVK